MKRVHLIAVDETLIAGNANRKVWEWVFPPYFCSENGSNKGNTISNYNLQWKKTKECWKLKSKYLSTFCDKLVAFQFICTLIAKLSILSKVSIFRPREAPSFF